MRLRHLNPHPPAGKINVTPLIDVVMVLIIFYLIVGKLASDRRANIDLPPSREGAPEGAGRTLTITVQPAPGGRTHVLVDGAEIGEGALESLLKARGPGVTVQLRADRGLQYSEVSPIIAACRGAGLASVKLVAEREGPGGGTP